MNLKELLAALEACQAEMESLLAKSKAEKDPESAKGIKALLKSKAAEFETLKGELEDAKALEATRKVVAEAKSLMQLAPANINPVNQPTTEAKAALHRIETPTDPVKDLQAKAAIFNRYVVGGGPASLQGQELEAVSAKSRVNSRTAIWMPPHMSAAIMAKTMLSTQTTGGATDSGANKLVPPNYIAQVLEMPVDIPAYADLVRKVPAAGGHWEFPMLDQTQGNFGGVSFAYATTEGAAKTETEPVFTSFSGVTKELNAYTAISNIMLSRSAIALESYLIGLFRNAFRMKLSSDIINGNGTTEIEGITNNALVTLVNRALANRISWADLTNMEYAITKGNRQGARFLLSDAAEGHLKGQLDDTKRPLFTVDPSTGMRSGLLGYSYMASEVGPALGTEGDVIFGNAQSYALGIEQDIAIDSSAHVRFIEGQTVYRVVAFVGGKVIHPTAFAMLSDPA